MIDDIELIYNPLSSVNSINRDPISISRAHDQIQLSNLNGLELKLEVHDLQGKMIFREIIINNSNHSIDISYLNNGFYILSIEEDKTLTNYKFLK